MEYSEHYLLDPQLQVLAGTDFSVLLINLVTLSMEILLLIIIVTFGSFVAFLVKPVKKRVRAIVTILHIGKLLQRERDSELIAVTRQ